MNLTTGRTIITLSLAFFCILNAMSQKINPEDARLIGGPCEGCEAIFESGSRILTPVDTLADFDDNGVKIKLSGIVYQNDAKTPAKDVVLYIYHTNQNGKYPTKGGEKGWSRRHGYIRGWAKTGVDGKYAFFTLKPGIYPSRTTPAHIHYLILEPEGKYYWLGSSHFEDDPLLTEKERNPESPRGGSSGLLTLKKEGSIRVGKRDIILGKNIPGYE